MRALWAAASGMKAQQLNIDNISNNLANVNTVGYKKTRVEFQDLLYENLRLSNFDQGVGRPVNLSVGHGVMSSATLKTFSKGNLEQTGNSYDFAVDGDGFFTIRDENNNTFYSKDGSFKISAEDGVMKLVTSDGYYVQGTDGDIELGENVESFTVSKDGTMKIKRFGNEEYEEIGVMSLVKFVNPAGLESIGNNLLKETASSGVPTEGEEGSNGNVLQGFLEMSNVQVVDEMIKMITAQRAYEINSKAIQTSDAMLEMANNLKR
jgi:flagellar basal-body rod protein FlgG